MGSITVKAPAKVNLYLKILSKRKDRYHNLHTLFERISIYDTIRVSKAKKGITIKADKPITRDPKDNIVYKAARAILLQGKVKYGVRIEIKKRIPIAAGLGGGSSDAAATLIGINSLFNLKQSHRTLMRIGRPLGADVPFFLLDTRFAVGKGRGDDLNIINTKRQLWHILVYPGFKVSTKDIYRVFDGLPARKSKGLTYSQQGAKIHSPLMGYKDMEQVLHNDLERAAVLQKSIIGSILASLAQLLGKKFIVSGSGPSLFCLYGTGKEAIEAKRTILRKMPANKRRGWQIFVVKTS